MTLSSTNPDTEQELQSVRLIERGRNDPVWWVKHALGSEFWPKQQQIIRAIPDHRITAVRSCHGVGKGLGLDLDVPTPTGFKRFGDLEVGDELFDESGEITRITHVHPVRELDCWEVEFDDGTKVVCDGDHLWTLLDLRTRNRLKMRHRGTDQYPDDWRDWWDDARTENIRDWSKELYAGKQRNLAVPLSRPLRCPDKELPIDPYVLGVWLGDGYSGGAAYAKPDLWIAEEIRRRGVEVRERSSKSGKCPSFGLFEKGAGAEILRDCGVLSNKHIPMEYQRASYQQRLDLIRGLMDTDGFHHKGSGVGIDLCHEPLAASLIDILNTMGWKVWHEVSDAKLYGRVTGRRWRIYFTPDVNPFALPRKAEKWIGKADQRQRGTTRTIVSIRRVRTVPTRCITVDNPRGLFLITRSFIPTHNSFLSARACLWYLYTHYPSLVITTAPGERQVKGILWKEIRSSVSKARIPLGGEMLKLQLNLDEDWFMWGFTAPEYDPDKFMGFHSEHILVAVDEACGVSQEIFDGGVAALMSNAGARLLMTGNPTDPNTYFGKIFKDPPSRTATFKIDAFDTPNFTAFDITQRDIENGDWIKKIDGRPVPFPFLVDPQWVSERYQDWGPDDPRYLARVLAEFPETSDKQLYHMAWVDRAMEEQDKGAFQPGKRRFGVDPAAFGSNESVIAYRNGNFGKIVSARTGLNTIDCAGWVKTLGIEYGISEATVDCIGIGRGVVDQLQAWRNYGQLPFEIVEFNSSASASNTEMFVNKRAEAHWHLRRMLERDELIVQKDKELRRQMLDMRFDLVNGRIKIESKEDMRRRGTESPDRCDALVYAFSDDTPVRRPIIIF